jgi:LPS-assembly protein
VQAGEIRANQIQRDPYGMIHAQGDVHAETHGLVIQAQSLSYDVDSQAATLTDARIKTKAGDRLSGQALHRIDLETFEGEGVTYTLCEDDSLAWKIVADDAKFDREHGIFEAHGAKFVWGGIPVLYTPYWQHALTRRSGLLMPSISNSTRRGFQWDIPFYWAGAPNWDMTLTSRSMKLRGTMADIEWRHRSAVGEEVLQVQAIKDKETSTSRGRLRTDMGWRLTPSIDASMDIDAVSDGLYIADFPFYSGDRESAPYLTSNALVAWRNGSDNAVLSTRYQQVLGGASNAATLQVLPRLQTRNYFGVFAEQDIKLEHQTTVFQRDVGVSGTRVGLRPSWSMPWQMEQGAVSANWTVLGQYVGYHSKQFTSTSSSYAALASSLQLEAKFERIFADRQWRHELKPIVRFDVSSTADQGANPRYDSSLLPLNMSNLLQGNRYSGWDRFERMRRVSFLLASSLQTKDDNVVRTVLDMKLGMAYDGLRETVDAAIAPAPSEAVSNLLAEIAWMPAPAWKLDAGGQHPVQGNRWVEAHGGIHWVGDKQYAHLSWRRTDASYSRAAEALTFSGRLKVSQGWSSYAHGQYDILRKHTIQTTLGLAYQHACWDMSIEGYKSYQVGSNSLTDIGWRFLLTFEGLGSFGDS